MRKSSRSSTPSMRLVSVKFHSTHGIRRNARIDEESRPSQSAGPLASLERQRHTVVRHCSTLADLKESPMTLASIRPLIALASLLGLMNSAIAADPTLVATDVQQVDRDFWFQGEYLGAARNTCGQ